MGPRPFSHGNYLSLFLFRGFISASMGPRPFSHGNLGRQRRELREQLASMGPRPFSHGNSDHPGAHGLAVPASMGPRPFSHGNHLLLPQSQVLLHRLQWGRDLSVTETWDLTPTNDGVSGFNGAATFQSRKPPNPDHAQINLSGLQWGRDLSVTETRIT